MNILCPQCQHILTQTDKHWHCDNQHLYDSAKQGYTNLLLVQNKRSKIPGDDINMVNARKRFLSQGHYQPLAMTINQLAQAHLADKEVCSILDAGCGEGYYSDQLQQSLQQHIGSSKITGIDISKFAVKAAAQRNKSIQWFVASSSHLPLAPQSCDLILSLFSPLPAAEFQRVIKHQGLLIVAATGQQHLMELREQLYQQVNDKVLNPSEKLADCFSPAYEKNLRYQLKLNSNQDIMDLLAMTPHYWRTSPDKKQQLSKLKKLDVSIDINITTFKPLSP